MKCPYCEKKMVEETNNLYQCDNDECDKKNYTCDKDGKHISQGSWDREVKLEITIKHCKECPYQQYVVRNNRTCPPASYYGHYCHKAKHLIPSLNTTSSVWDTWDIFIPDWCPLYIKEEHN